MTIKGKIVDGNKNGSKILSRYKVKIESLLGVDNLYPGSLNVELPSPLILKAHRGLLRQGKLPLLFTPCTVFNKRMWLISYPKSKSSHTVEIVTDTHLRSEHNLATGDVIELTIDTKDTVWLDYA